MPAAPRRRPAPRSPRGDIRRRGSLVRSRSVTSRPYRPGSSSPIGLIRADRPRPHPKSPRTDMRRRPDMPRKPRDVSLTALLEESRNSNGSDVARFRRLGARTVTTRPEFAGCDNLIQISIHRSANWTGGRPDRCAGFIRRAPRIRELLVPLAAIAVPFLCGASSRPVGRTAIAHVIDRRPQLGRKVPTSREIQEVARKCRQVLLQKRHEFAPLDVRPEDLFRAEGQPSAGTCRADMIQMSLVVIRGFTSTSNSWPCSSNSQR